METRINPQNITHIKVHDLTETNRFYRPEKVNRYLFGLFKETEYEGYYFTGGLSGTPYFDFSIEDIQNSKTYRDIDGILWTNPRIEIFAGKERLRTQYFETYDQALNYVSKTFPNIKRY